MNVRIHKLGTSITHFLIDTLPKEYLCDVFSEHFQIDDLVDQVILECVKNAYDSTQEKHSLRYYLNQLGELTDDARMKYSRAIALSNKYKRAENERAEKLGLSQKYEAVPDMTDMQVRLEGYHLREMNFFELTNISRIELIKAVINHRMSSTKKISNTRFSEIAKQYDKFAISLLEQSQESDEKMVFNSLAYFTLEWKYAFHFLYQCALQMEQAGLKSAELMAEKIRILLGYWTISSDLDICTSKDSRMVGLRERFIPVFLNGDFAEKKYSEFLALLTIILEKCEVDGISIKQWFIVNTDIHDWADFLRDYDVFRFSREQKEYPSHRIQNMRSLYRSLFPENPENRSYTDASIDDNLLAQFIEEAIPMSRIDCYIEEYTNNKGGLCARLREKASETP